MNDLIEFLAYMPIALIIIPFIQFTTSFHHWIALLSIQLVLLFIQLLCFVLNQIGKNKVQIIGGGIAEFSLQLTKETK